MDAIARALSLFKWLFYRLPITFSLPFALITLWWIFGGFKDLNRHVAVPAVTLVTRALESWLPGALAHQLVENLDDFLLALVVLGLFLLGLLAAYNVSALFNFMLLAAGMKPIHYANGAPQTPETAERPGADPFANVRKIGIVLAGGGAKGAFQAGAMKAIYRFLAEHGALAKVKVVSGTSIGSWNALFWLSDLIKSETGWQAPGVHERWWRGISARSLAAPSWYVPFLRNAFLSSAPWRRVFDHIFSREDVAKRLAGTGIHFYLTRSKVRSGELECVTNNPAPPALARVSYEILDRAAGDDAFMEGVKAGVFASMDLPPLFPYVERNGKLFEDGGVIDNLPITFAALEGCDLLFVLPLNADFEEEPSRTSIAARLFRVMDIRQGVIERSNLKILYLYNELAALRRFAADAANPEQRAKARAVLKTTLERTNSHMNVFAVCPQRSFVEATINTQELWKAKEAGIAFGVMHDATAKLLGRYDFGNPNDVVRVALISRGGIESWDERF